MFKTFKLNNAMSRLVDERLYELVMDELSSGNIRKGIWAKALARSNGNKDQAEAKYIELRVESLKDEAHVVRSIVETIENQKHGKEVTKNEKQIIVQENNKKGPAAILFGWLLGILFRFVAAIAIGAVVILIMKAFNFR